MLISHRYRFIYTKTSKTASTSVESYFEPFCMPEGHWQQSHSRETSETEAGVVGYRGDNTHEQKWHGHMPAAQIHAQVPSEVWDNYFKFCIVRDPFDKAVSAFHFAEHNQDKKTGLQKLPVRIKRFFRGSSEITRFRKWVARGRFHDDRDKYMIDGKVCVDYFIRYEALQEGIKHVCDTVGVPFEPERLPKFKTGIRPQERSLKDYYDEKTAALIAQQFSWELGHFGYKSPLED